MEIRSDPHRSPERNKGIPKVVLLMPYLLYVYIYTLYTIKIYMEDFDHRVWPYNTVLFALCRIKIYMEDSDHNSTSTFLLYMYFAESNAIRAK